MTEDRGRTTEIRRLLSVVRPLDGGVAQLGEHLLCKQGVVGSSPITSTTDESAAFIASCTAAARRQWFAKQTAKGAGTWCNKERGKKTRDMPSASPPGGG